VERNTEIWLLGVEPGVVKAPLAEYMKNPLWWGKELEARGAVG
jgi:hypothetical protein